MARPKKTEPYEKKKTSLQLRADSVRAIEYISYKDKKTLTDLIDEALYDLIAKWERKNGAIPK